jgi:methyl-accepting chemotaxis protein
MTNKIATGLAGGTPHDASRALHESLRLQLEGTRPELVLLFASTKQPLAALMTEMQGCFPDSLLLGASTAGEFTEQGDAKGAVAACAITGDIRVQAGMAENLKEDVVLAMQTATGALSKEIDGYPHRAALLLLDPLTGSGEEATLLAASLLGPNTPLAGGAAGDDLRMQSTQVGLGTRVASGAAVVAILHSKRPFGIGVAHGHRPLSGVLRVTRAEGNTVHELDGKPAWKVWAERTRESAAVRNINPDDLAPADLGAYLLRYEAGLRVGEDYKIRAPLGRGADGSLSFACGIAQGAEIQITESVPERQIESARRAAQLARAGVGGAKVCGALVFDCICRNLIWGPRFHDAVSAIRDELGNVPLAGFETYGEIALGAGDMSGFHNTTTVVLALTE